VRSRLRDVAVVVLAGAAVAAGAVEARRGRVRPAEARCFDALNGVTDRAFAPTWVVMQLGSLGGALATGATVIAAGHGGVGRRVATVGALAWLGSKIIKPFARRGRPTAVLVGPRVLGRDQAGLGYPSGHAAVAAAMAASASPHLRRRVKAPLWLTAAGIGATRVYIGAHLPLDVAGGLALGVAVERCARVLLGPSVTDRA